MRRFNPKDWINWLLRYFKPKSKKKSKKPRNIGKEILSGIGIPLILALIIKASVVEAYVIPSGSMEKTLYTGDQILGNKFVYGMRLPIPYVDIKLPAIDDPKPGDIVVFRYPPNPTQNYIKRCVAVEGQTVEIKNKKLYVDGELVNLPPDGQFLDKRVIPPYDEDVRWKGGWRDNMPKQLVPKGKLFVMGDNRDNSFDSRFWGYVDRDQVLARAIIVLWSWEYPEQINTRNGLSNVDLWMYTLKHFPYLIQHMRYDRFFKIAL